MYYYSQVIFTIRVQPLSANESCAVISVAKAKEWLNTEVLAEEALSAVSIILFSAVSQIFGGFLTDGQTSKRYVLSKGTEYAGLSSVSLWF